MKKTILSLLVVFTILLAGCQMNTPQVATATKESLPTITPFKEPTLQAEAVSAAAPLPPVSTEWGDMSIYAAGLRPEFQDILENSDDASEYHIVLNIPANLPAPINGALAVRYTNRETVPLGEIYFRLFPPIYTGELDVTNVLVDNSDVATFIESENTALRITLPTPLEVGESLVISMDFLLTLPETLDYSYGLLGYFGRTLSLDTFYPMIPAYDADHGWYSQTPPGGGYYLTYQDMSYYQVTVRAPESFVLAASGIEVDRTTTDGIQQVTFAAGPMRDFYISGSYDYTVVSEEINGVTVNSYGKPGYEYGQEIGLYAGVNGIELFGELFGEYVYTEFDIVNSDIRAYSIEYPGITNIYDDLYTQASSEPDLTTLETEIAHQVGHQWFYSMVGNDQQNHPWLDESVAQYVTYLYILEQFGETTADQTNIHEWEFRMSRMEREVPIGLAMSEFGRFEFSGAVLGRGPLFFLELEKIYGQEMVIEALRDYFQKNLWGIGTEEKMCASLEAACDCDLSEMFAEWID